MKAVVQRVKNASVTVGGELKGVVGAGLLVYVGVARGDTEADAGWLAEKTANLRIFDDSEGIMNWSLIDIINQNNLNNNFNEGGGAGQGADPPTGVLAISQFTLLGDAAKGRRPSWAKAAPPEEAKKLYLHFTEKIRARGVPCETGEFQARMLVNYTNDGPVTILLDSRAH